MHPILQANAFLRAAYEGKIDVVLEMLDDGVPVETCNQVKPPGNMQILGNLSRKYMQ